MATERRALVPEDLLREGPITLPPAAAKHLAVLRLQPGDRLELIDGMGRAAAATFEGTGRVLAGPPERAMATETMFPLRLMFGVPKGEAADSLIRACTELGVSSFEPLVTERTVSKPKPGRVDRWRRIAESAALQSGRYVVPSILPLAPLSESLQALGKIFTLRVAAWARESSTPMPPRTGHQAGALLIGPEGGLTQAEADLARAHDFQTVTLGPRVLRTPTAAAAACALLLCR